MPVLPTSMTLPYALKYLYVWKWRSNTSGNYSWISSGRFYWVTNFDCWTCVGILKICKAGEAMQISACLHFDKAFPLLRITVICRQYFCINWKRIYWHYSHMMVFLSTGAHFYHIMVFLTHGNISMITNGLIPN